MKTPTWDEVREFLQHDRWTADRKRSTDHDYFTKTLPDGEILITKVSRSSEKTMSPGRFKAILSDQLRLGGKCSVRRRRLRGRPQRPNQSQRLCPSGSRAS